MPALTISIASGEPRFHSEKRKSNGSSGEVQKLTEDLSVLSTSVFFYTRVDLCRVEATLAEPRAVPAAAGKRLERFEHLERLERAAVLVSAAV
jgi:hypothetical protein